MEIRPATADLPPAGGPRAVLVAWVRFRDDRAVDAAAVATLADVLPPALYALWNTPRPVPTAEMTVHFADALDDGAAHGWSLVRIRTEHAGGAGRSTTAPCGRRTGASSRRPGRPAWCASR
ncbi:hypothetical protein [Streptomyces albogriseolus]|uniref:hypothetical protein n=1 Tax=Streptomyces albogriseolus TaxID=1887 RepID=UPI00339E3F1F